MKSKGKVTCNPMLTIDEENEYDDMIEDISDKVIMLKHKFHTKHNNIMPQFEPQIGAIENALEEMIFTLWPANNNE